MGLKVDNSLEIAERCAVCGILRQKANHWYLIAIKDGWLSAKPLTQDDLEEMHRRFLMDGTGCQLVCGEGCLHKALQQTIVHVRIPDMEATTLEGE